MGHDRAHLIRGRNVHSARIRARLVGCEVGDAPGAQAQERALDGSRTAMDVLLNPPVRGKHRHPSSRDQRAVRDGRTAAPGLDLLSFAAALDRQSWYSIEASSAAIDLGHVAPARELLDSDFERDGDYRSGWSALAHGVELTRLAARRKKSFGRRGGSLRSWSVRGNAAESRESARLSCAEQLWRMPSWRRMTFSGGLAPQPSTLVFERA